MMEKEISIHRALAQLKTTTARIDNIISNAKFVSLTIGQSGTANGKTIELCEREIQSNYDAVVKLINNYQTIKLAIIRSNSGINNINESLIEKVTVLDTDMTISEMLCIHSYVIPYQKKLLRVLKEQLGTCTYKVEYSQTAASEKIANMISQMGNNNSEEKLSKETIEQISKAYRDNNCVFLVDPLNINDKINELSKYIEDFEEVCDATLSEQNSLKKITVDFDD